MGANTSIEWAHHTFNPWVGCERISPACDDCYAATWAKRAGRGHLWEGKRERTAPANWRQPLKWNAEAQRLGVRYRVFCASLADVFDNQVPPEWRADLFRLIRQTEHLDWLLLTKRIGNAARMLDETGYMRTSREPVWPWPNVAIGATIANQAEADRDIPKLLEVPARVRFLSCEPLLGPLDLSKFMRPIAMMSQSAAPETWAEWNARDLWPAWVPLAWRTNIEEFWSERCGRGPRAWLRDAVEQRAAPFGAHMGTTEAIGGGSASGRFVHTWNNMCILVDDAGTAHVTSTPRAGLFDAGPSSSAYQPIQWVIAGGESGGKARPAHPDWFRSIRDQCVEACVPFLFKQWGEWAPGENSAAPPTRTERVATFFNNQWDFGTLTPRQSAEMHCDDAPDVYRLGKKNTGRVLDCRTWNQFPVIGGAP